MVIRAETSAAAFFAAMAHNAAAGVRHCSASQPKVRVSERYPFLVVGMRQRLQLRADVVGVLVGLQYA